MGLGLKTSIIDNQTIVFFRIETIFDLIYYNNHFEVRLKSYYSIELQAKLITVFFYAVNYSSNLVFLKTKDKLNKKTKNKKKIQKISRKLQNELQTRKQ